MTMAATHVKAAPQDLAGQLTAPRLLLVLVAASFLLRCALIWHGGQMYWPDEQRYAVSRQAARELLAGEFRPALKTLHTADHFLFKVIGVIPAIGEQFIREDTRIPAAFFAVFSTLNIYLLWRIARSAGASEATALFAAFLLAASTSFLYYSRHLLPYDTAMALGLLALAVTLGRPASLGRLACAGVLCSACVLCYNGYWTLAVLVLGIGVVWRTTGWRQLSLRTLVAGLSFGIPIVGLLVGSKLLGGHLLSEFVVFSRSIRQGEFSEGWRLPVAYLWSAEHGLMILWALGIAAGQFYLLRRDVRRAPGNKRAVLLLGCGGAVLIYAMLAASSTGLHRFVVYGRLTRQIVPFASLATAQVLVLWPGSKRGWLMVAAGLVALQAAANFWAPWTQVFPDRFLRQTEVALQREHGASGGHVVLFAEHLYPVPEAVAAPAGMVRLKAAHPLQYPPYQYEGFTPAERAALRSRDISMRLIILENEMASDGARR